MNKLLALALLLLPALALPNGYDVPNVNPRDMAMVSSGLAAQESAGAAFVNPAALSRLSGLNLDLAVSMLDLETKWTGPADGSALQGQSARTKFRPVFPPSLFVAYGTKLGDRNVGVGAGLNIPGGGNVFWHDDWPGRGRIITVDRKIYGLYLTGGVEVLEGLRLGGGLVYYYGTEYLKQGIQPDNDAYAELSTRGGAASFDLSAEYAVPSLPLTLALDFKYKATMKLKGDAHFQVPDALRAASDPPLVDQDARHHLTYPDVLNLGAAYRVTEPWLLTATWTWNGYHVYAADVFQGTQGITIEVPRHYRNGQTFRLGTEYAVLPNLLLRGGVERDLSGLNTEFYSPTLPDSDAWCIGLGAGWKLSPDLMVQAGFFYAWLDKVTVTGHEEFPGNYLTRVWIASAGVVWHSDILGGR